jgi:hypothetical protein
MHKIQRADVFIVLDNIQYNKNGFQNRNRIKVPGGDLMLTVPVRERLGQRLDEVAIDNTQRWARKHLKSIAQNYRRAPYFEAHYPWLESIYTESWSELNALNRTLLEGFVERLGIETQLVYASTLKVPGEATTRLVNLVQAVGGDAYLSGAYAVDTYLDTAAFEAAGITLEIQSWSPPEYPQCSSPFVPELSVLDLLLNCGPESAALLAEAGR